MRPARPAWPARSGCRPAEVEPGRRKGAGRILSTSITLGVSGWPHAVQALGHLPVATPGNSPAEGVRAITSSRSSPRS